MASGGFVLAVVIFVAITFVHLSVLVHRASVTLDELQQNRDFLSDSGTIVSPEERRTSSRHLLSHVWTDFQGVDALSASEGSFRTLVVEDTLISGIGDSNAWSWL
jgi:hypothetical protein